MENFMLVVFCLSICVEINGNAHLIKHSQASKPHILFLLVDDWGWANVGYHRNPPTREVVTPNFDSLVKQGLELDQHYVYPVCSPSRSSFLSGRLPIHVNDVNIPGWCYNPKDPVSGFQGIPRNMTTIATKLKEAGYKTHMVGKWHAGMATPDHIPTGRGFDTSFGYMNAANDYYSEQCDHKCGDSALPDLWDTDHPAKTENGTDYEEALFKQHVLDVVGKHDPNELLFLYYAPHIAHKPYQVPNEYLKKFNFIDDANRQYYQAMVNYLDDIVGDLTELLKKRGLWDNLLFVVSSDNGGPVHSDSGGNNYPLKGGKESNWQGGVRVNAFVTGGYLPKEMVGKKTEEYIHIADWYATFCALAGVNPTDKAAVDADLPPIDSLNMWPLISGINTTSPRIEMVLSSASMISGPYKIITGSVRQAGWTGPQYPNSSAPAGISTVEHCAAGCLYNIRTDPQERINLANDMHGKLTEMHRKLQEELESHFSPDRGEIWQNACDVFEKEYGGFWGPFLP